MFRLVMRRGKIKLVWKVVCFFNYSCLSSNGKYRSCFFFFKVEDNFCYKIIVSYIFYVKG